MRAITEIILHTTATAPGWMEGHSAQAKVKEIRRWHVDRKFSDIGYHFVIDRDGEVAKGRPIEQTGAHVKGRNTGTIGIALVGGRDGKATDKFRDNYTDAQERGLIKLIRFLHENYGVVPVTGHNQYAAKECPCFDAPKWWAGVNASKVTAPVVTAAIGGAAGAMSDFAGLPPAATVAIAIGALVLGYLIIRKVTKK